MCWIVTSDPGHVCLSRNAVTALPCVVSLGLAMSVRSRYKTLSVEEISHNWKALCLHLACLSPKEQPERELPALGSIERFVQEMHSQTR